MPALEVAVADRATGRVRGATQAMAPTWSPALTLDGSAVVFVSGVRGTPRLFRVAEGGDAELLPDLGRFPSAPTPPRFQGDLYVFEDHLGVVWADLEQGRIVRTEASR